MHTLYGKLKLIGGEDLVIWLDTEELKKSGQVDSDSLKRHVKKSLALLVFLSEEFPHEVLPATMRFYLQP